MYWPESNFRTWEHWAAKMMRFESLQKYVCKMSGFDTCETAQNTYEDTHSTEAEDDNHERFVDL
jgi:hypothetical protein